MKRVIYATSDLDGWADVAKNMQTKMEWEPIYWITSPKNKPRISGLFPSIICQGNIDAIQGKYSKHDREKFKISLDENLINKYSYYEKLALKMMDRMDPTAYSFNLTERIELYYEFLEYWLNQIGILKPDFVLFSESPHGLLSFVLYAVCKEEDIKILRFVPTYVEGLTFLASCIEKESSYLDQEYVNCLKENNNKESFLIANRYVEKNRKPYQEAIPYYMVDIIKKSSLKDNMYIFYGKGIRFFKNKIFIAFKKSSSHSLKESNITKFDLLRYKIKGYFYKKNLQKIYNKLAESVNFTDSYVYVALHYQPEKTTSPEGGIFVDQLLMIKMLSLHVQDGWKIYVKEHISQFSEKLYGEQGRNAEFYYKLSQMDNVVLVKSDINSFDLIDNSKSIATVTGTVGLEGVIRSKPVLSFGYPWYSICHGVFNIKNSKTLKEVLENIEKGYQVDSTKVDYFLYTIEKVSLPCYINPGNKVSVSCSESQNIDNLTSILLNYFDKV